MNLGKKMRMRRIFARGKSLIVPIDHGIYFEPSGHLKNLGKLVKMIAGTDSDGIIISSGMLEHVSDVVGDLAVILRIGETHTRMGKHLERTKIASTIEHAVTLGADAVIFHVLIGVDNEDEHMEKLGKAAAQCYKLGMPLVAEMLPASILYYQYGMTKKQAPGADKDIRMVSRLAAELGADVVKTQYTGSVKTFSEVVESTPLPILIAGGPKVNTDGEFLKTASDCMKAGAAGICIGRNVWGRQAPKGIIGELLNFA